MISGLDLYLLELILMDTISVAGDRCNPKAELVIQRYIPANLSDLVIAHYDHLSADSDENASGFLRHWFRIAAEQDSRWKRKMIMRFLAIVSAGGPLGMAELADVAALAAKIQARRECRLVYRTLFGRIPVSVMRLGRSAHGTTPVRDAQLTTGGRSSS